MNKRASASQLRISTPGSQDQGMLDRDQQQVRTRQQGRNRSLGFQWMLCWPASRSDF